MTFRLILFGIISISVVHSHESESSEVNRIEVAPLYDTIIFSDVADIINEFDNNNNVNPIDALFTSASESDENIEDLLSEYQHYLEKAHKQRINYLEKGKSKNKVPLTRHDRYAKTKSAGGIKYDDYFYPNGYINPGKLSSASYSSPLDLFIPISPKLRYINKSDLTNKQGKENLEDTAVYDKRLLELPPVFPKARYDPLKSSCFCKIGQMPCECKCKQCLIPFDAMQQNYIQHTKFLSGDAESKGFLSNAENNADDRSHDGVDNTLNIRIKVDIQLPRTQEIFSKFFKNRSRDDIYNSKESTVNLPFPYFNFPIPMDLFGYKKSSKFNNHDSAHKITIHKKKKTRLNNGSKKHRKKVITFHNLNIHPQQPAKTQSFLEENYNNTDYNEKTLGNSNQTYFHNISLTEKQKPEGNNNFTNIVNKTKDTVVNNETQTEESIFVMVNISNAGDNGTEDAHKIENSVETDFTKVDFNIPTEKQSNLRKKRDISIELKHNNPKIKNVSYKKSNETLKLLIIPLKNETKKTDKVLLADSELIYWPNNNKNQATVSSKNITTIILERENKKAKLNMTNEAIRSNRTRALERAIFGDVNWDDVDTVAPAFLSFVGKYLRGVLTFCSQNICHSMKCAEKTCVHRICNPDNRWNHRGHCTGTNNTDSIASLESIMDLPSNIAFEIVDILQDKMLGKLFGKVTLCITSKCISFIASKKNFLKSKCSLKELKMGHCPNIKNFKIM